MLSQEYDAVSSLKSSTLQEQVYNDLIDSCEYAPYAGFVSSSVEPQYNVLRNDNRIFQIRDDGSLRPVLREPPRDTVLDHLIEEGVSEHDLRRRFMGTGVHVLMPEDCDTETTHSRSKLYIGRNNKGLVGWYEWK